MHNESIRICFSRRKITTGIDVELKIELEKRELYWRSIIETVIFLSGRGLAFRGNNETLGSINNGNYLGCLKKYVRYVYWFTSSNQRKIKKRNEAESSLPVNGDN